MENERLEGEDRRASLVEPRPDARLFQSADRSRAPLLLVPSFAASLPSLPVALPSTYRPRARQHARRDPGPDVQKQNAGRAQT